MPRYILIDRNSGYIWGDTADFAAGRQSDLTPETAASLLLKTLGEGEVEFVATYRHDPAATFDVYRDASGGDAVPVVQDGQDQAAIMAVEAQCTHTATLRPAN